MPTMLDKAALHFHHLDMGCETQMRSYNYAQATQLRNELLQAGYTESQVDANGKLNRDDYFYDGDPIFDDEPAATTPEEPRTPSQLDQLANVPQPLKDAATAYLEEQPEGVLMVAQDGMDALVLEVGDVERVVWVSYDGEVRATAAAWSVLQPGAE